MAKLAGLTSRWMNPSWCMPAQQEAAQHIGLGQLAIKPKPRDSHSGVRPTGDGAEEVLADGAHSGRIPLAVSGAALPRVCHIHAQQLQSITAGANLQTRCVLLSVYEPAAIRVQTV